MGRGRGRRRGGISESGSCLSGGAETAAAARNAAAGTPGAVLPAAVAAYSRCWRLRATAAKDESRCKAAARAENQFESFFLCSCNIFRYFVVKSKRLSTLCAGF